MEKPDRDRLAVLGALGARGIASSRDLQRSIGKSQPTVSRILGDLSSQIVTLGGGRSALYGLPNSIHGLPARQPIWWTTEDGAPLRLGTLTLLAKGVLHVELDEATAVVSGRLPWYLSPLRAQGFLGRLLAQSLAASGVPPNPEAWDVETTLFAALQLRDAPGAIVLGEPSAAPANPVPSEPAELAAALDALSSDVASTLPAGSSAGGEQPKFLALLDTGEHVLVKFTPPRGTPFGERWHDLLHAEVLACEVLERHGVGVASSTIVESSRRTYLVSKRFDRLGREGRRHVVSVGAVHEAFVAGGYQHWAATCEALTQQRRLPPLGGRQARALLDFGYLIGNTDMHSGNLGLFVTRDGLSRGRFELAPVYDMLPMRWRPDPVFGGAADYSPFEPNPISLAGPARVPAAEFWARLAEHGGVSPALRSVANEMASRLG